MTEHQPTILFAGGGTGGHLFPSLAVAERLRERGHGAGVWFACSDRPLDARLLADAGQPFTPLSVRPLPAQPWRAPAFVRHYLRARAAAGRLIRQRNIRAVVAMGGFVSGPVVAAARRLGVPAILVNLDAVPGKANRWLARRCDRILSVYPTSRLPTDRTQRIAMPLRRSAIGPDDPAEARRELGLDPATPLLLVTGASQGAESVNRAMVELAARPRFREAAAGWRVLHLAGAGRAAAVERAYRQSGLSAMVMEFCDRMGLAWAAAEVAISRAGAGSVAEAAANGAPTLFLPYPHHRDQHQRHNAAPLVEAGGALIVEDAGEGPANADRLLEPLTALMEDGDRRAGMRRALRRLGAGDGAERLADEVMHLAGLV